MVISHGLFIIPNLTLLFIIKVFLIISTCGVIFLSRLQYPSLVLTLYFFFEVKTLIFR